METDKKPRPDEVSIIRNTRNSQFYIRKIIDWQLMYYKLLHIFYYYVQRADNR